jgi:hypothetical protein
MADGRTRALYGHSVPDKLERTASTPPERLYHGTSPTALDAIRHAGLQPMRRQYVHLSNTLAEAIEVGRAQESSAGDPARGCSGRGEERRRLLCRQRQGLAGRSRALAIHRHRRLKTWG